MAYLVIIVVYSLAQIALGVWVARRLKGSSDFFVAGRSLGPGLLAATMLAANIGGGSTVGAAARGYRDGLSAWWWVGGAAIGSVALAIWVGPRIRRLAVFAVALPLALGAAGGFAGLHAAIPDAGSWSLWRNAGSGWIYVAVITPAFIVSPGLLQKVYGAKDDRAVRLGVGVNALVLF